MRRIVEPGRIVYVERHWKLSFLMFLLAAGTLGFPLLLDPPPRRDDLGGFCFTALCFLLVSLSLQHQSRAFIVDLASGLLVVLERRFFRSTDRKEVPLRDVRVAVTSAVETRVILPDIRRYWIWIEMPGQPRILFRGFLQDSSGVQEAVLGLRQDLEAPGPLGSGLGPRPHA